jgi:hypothetical protein
MLSTFTVVNLLIGTVVAFISGKPDLLSLSAVVSDEHDNARIECWQFTMPFTKYPTVGKSLPLSDVSNLTYVVLPPKSQEGLHNPPHPMLFVLLSGMAHVVLPDFSDELWISEWSNNVIVATDMEGVGHYTTYPLSRESVALQIPFKDGRVPDHKVLGNGACKKHQSGKNIQDLVDQRIT